MLLYKYLCHVKPRAARFSLGPICLTLDSPYSSAPQRRPGRLLRLQSRRTGRGDRALQRPWKDGKPCGRCQSQRHARTSSGRRKVSGRRGSERESARETRPDHFNGISAANHLMTTCLEAVPSQSSTPKGCRTVARQIRDRSLGSRTEFRAGPPARSPGGFMEWASIGWGLGSALGRRRSFAVCTVGTVHRRTAWRRCARARHMGIRRASGAFRDSGRNGECLGSTKVLRPGRA